MRELWAGFLWHLVWVAPLAVCVLSSRVLQSLLLPRDSTRHLCRAHPLSGSLRLVVENQSVETFHSGTGMLQDGEGTAGLTLSSKCSRTRGQGGRTQGRGSQAGHREPSYSEGEASSQTHVTGLLLKLGTAGLVHKGLGGLTSVVMASASPAALHAAEVLSHVSSHPVTASSWSLLNSAARGGVFVLIPDRQLPARCAAYRIYLVNACCRKASLEDTEHGDTLASETAGVSP